MEQVSPFSSGVPTDRNDLMLLHTEHFENLLNLQARTVGQRSLHDSYQVESAAGLLREVASAKSSQNEARYVS